MIKEQKNKAEIFVNHIKEHIKQLPPEERKYEKVMCKICGKTIDEIYEEETSKGIWIQPGVYDIHKSYVDRNGRPFKVVLS